MMQCENRIQIDNQHESFKERFDIIICAVKFTHSTDGSCAFSPTIYLCLISDVAIPLALSPTISNESASASCM